MGTKRKKICCICGKPFKEWGNNPWPIKEEGTCCNACNQTRVIPARIHKIKETQNANR